MMTEPQENAGKDLDDLVEDALLRRATGYEDPAGKPVPPDVRAAMYWLENRRPDRWKRRREPQTPEPEIEFTAEEDGV